MIAGFMYIREIIKVICTLVVEKDVVKNSNGSRPEFLYGFK